LKAPLTSLRVVFVFGFIAVAACTTGTDVSDSTAAPDERARLDRIAVVAHRLVENARAQPQKPASALMEDLVTIMNDAESE
jgi:hypothetical protein